jgi:hypothetical protein
MRKLDWKWIAIGVVVMVALSLIAGIVLALVLGPQVKDINNVQNITLSGGQLVLIAVINILVFAVGGFIVGVDPRVARSSNLAFLRQSPC